MATGRLPRAGWLAWALAFVSVMLLIDLGILRPWQARANRWRQDAP